ncbi:hypothetical protein WJX72_000804 [[Myrmecia] bisecta]|uniref:BZIP domain-containing protein n=1 Tax=[Myrmecia] bisecta TaxID=41462 RepID=A0AAW1PAC9_9CHLO
MCGGFTKSSDQEIALSLGLLTTPVNSEELRALPDADFFRVYGALAARKHGLEDGVTEGPGKQEASLGAGSVAARTSGPHPTVAKRLAITLTRTQGTTKAAPGRAAAQSASPPAGGAGGATFRAPALGRQGLRRMASAPRSGSAGPSNSAASLTSSNEAAEQSDGSDEQTRTPSRAKRKAADPVNLDDITDPAERRKQRRLAKNRATAALSRERKRAQFNQLQARLKEMEDETARLTYALSSRDAEVVRLREQLLASSARGARSTSGEEFAAFATESAELEALPLAAMLLTLALFISLQAFIAPAGLLWRKFTSCSKALRRAHPRAASRPMLCSLPG